MFISNVVQFFNTYVILIFLLYIDYWKNQIQIWNAKQ